MSDKILFTIPEAAELLNISRASTEALIKSKQLPVVRIGRSIRLHIDTVSAFAKTGTENRTTHGAPLHELWQSKGAA